MSNRAKLYQDISNNKTDGHHHLHHFEGDEEKDQQKSIEQIAIESEIAEFRQAARKREEDLITCAAENNSLKKKYQYLDSEHKALQRQYEVLQKKYTANEVSSKAATTTTDKSVADQKEMNDELRLLRLQSEQDAAVISDLKSKLENALLDSSRYHRECKNLKKALSDSLQRNVSLSEEACNLQNNNAALMTRLSETSVELDRLRNETISEWFLRTGRRDIGAASQMNSSRLNSSRAGSEPMQQHNNNQNQNHHQYHQRPLSGGYYRPNSAPQQHTSSSNHHHQQPLPSVSSPTKKTASILTNHDDDHDHHERKQASSLSTSPQPELAPTTSSSTNLRPWSSGARPPRPLSSKFVREGSLGGFVDISNQIQTPARGSSILDTNGTNSGRQSSSNPNQVNNSFDDMNDMNVYWQRPRTAGSVATLDNDTFSNYTNSRVASANYHNHPSNHHRQQAHSGDESGSSSNHAAIVVQHQSSSVVAHNVFTVVDDENFNVDDEIYDDDADDEAEEAEEEADDENDDANVGTRQNSHQHEEYIIGSDNSSNNSPSHQIVQHQQQQQQQSPSPSSSSKKHNHNLPSRQHVSTYQPHSRMDVFLSSSPTTQDAGEEQEEQQENYHNHQRKQQQKQNEKYEHDEQQQQFHYADAAVSSPPVHYTPQQRQQEFQQLHQQLEQKLHEREQTVGQKEYFYSSTSSSPPLSSFSVMKQQRTSNPSVQTKMSPHIHFQHQQQQHNHDHSPNSQLQEGEKDKSPSSNHSSPSLADYRKQLEIELAQEQRSLSNPRSSNNNNNSKGTKNTTDDDNNQRENSHSIGVVSQTTIASTSSMMATNDNPSNKDNRYNDHHDEDDRQQQSYHRYQDSRHDRNGNLSMSDSNNNNIARSQQQQQSHHRGEEPLTSEVTDKTNSNLPAVTRMNRPGRAGAKTSKYGASRGLPNRYVYAGYTANENDDANAIDDETSQQSKPAASASTPQPNVYSSTMQQRDAITDDTSYENVTDRHNNTFSHHHNHRVIKQDEEKPIKSSAFGDRFPPGRLRPSNFITKNVEDIDDGADDDASSPSDRIQIQDISEITSNQHHQNQSSTTTIMMSNNNSNNYDSPSTVITSGTVLHHHQSATKSTKAKIPAGLPPLGLSAERAERLSARKAQHPPISPLGQYSHYNNNNSYRHDSVDNKNKNAIVDVKPSVDID